MAKQFHIANKQKIAVRQPFEGFDSGNQHRKRKDQELAEFEKEVMKADAEWKAQVSGEAPEDTDEAEDTQEATKKTEDNHDWKKRYSDLRSASAKKENELQSRIEALEQAMKAQEAPAESYPTSEDDYEAWVKEYPDVAKVFETMILKKSKDTNEKLEATQKEIAATKLRNAFEAAYNKILKAHPDFDDIKTSDEFKAWMAEQPKNIYDSINSPSGYDDEAVRAAVYTIDLYKERGPGKKAKPKATRDQEAAKTVKSSGASAPDLDNGKPTFSESQIQAMTSREFEKYQEAIFQAQEEGRFEYDISGGAR